MWKRLTRVFRQAELVPSHPPLLPLMRGRIEYLAYEIGAWSYGNPRVLSWGEGAKLRVGKFCSIADGVTILLGGNHRTDWITTYPFNAFWPEAKEIHGHPMTHGDVVIENDVWIGLDAVILSGVRIGNGAVIGARSVVTRDVDAYSIVAGNPARKIRDRFTRKQIDDLQQIAWWNWSEEKIRLCLPVLLSGRVDAFIGHSML